MLVEEQIQARQERAKTAVKKIAVRPSPGPFGDYEIVSTSGKEYRVALRGPGLFDNYCSCPDFAVNTLGTCKHIESLLERLRSRRKTALQRARAHRTRASLSLLYGETVEVRLRLPDRPSPELRRAASHYFDAAGILPRKHYPRFGDILDKLRRVDDAAVVYSDVIEYVDRVNEIDEGLKLERRELKKLDANKLPLDKLLKVRLFPYQMRGALFAACRGRVLLADDMGLGKTIQAIAAVELLRQRRGISRVLVIAPSSVKYQWKTEIEKFSNLPVKVIDGTMPGRRKLYQNPAFFNLINYELALRDLEQIQGLNPDVIILDEAQRIRNWKTQTARSVKQLKSRYAFVLTGTPLENKLEELYSVVEFLDGRLLGPVFRFLKEHVQATESGKVLGYRGLDKIRARLEPILLRRTRAEVLQELPKRSDQIFRVTMTKQQLEPYEEQEQIVARILQKWQRQGWLSDIDLRVLACSIQNMRMLCNSTFLFDKETNFSPKLKEFREIIRELVLEEDRKVVVFSEYARMTALAAAELKKLKIGHVSLDGSVPGRKRGALMQRFREDPECRVFLSTDAGGVGINLQSASAVINFEPPWNPARLEQRIARVHRMGQLHPVQVIHLLTENSIEERVWEVIGRKKALFAGIFDAATDEVDFEKLGRRSMLQDLKQVLAEKPPALSVPRAASHDGEPAQPPPEESPVAGAIAGLVEAGLRVLEALAPNNAAARPSAPQSSSALSQLVREDPATKRPVLSIPLPQNIDAERLSNALGGLLEAFRPRN